MNRLQLVQRLHQECGVSGSRPTTTLNLTGELNRLVGWVDAAWNDIQGKHQNWKWLRATATFPTVAGQATYTPAQIGLTDFGMWDRETFRNYVNPTVEFSVGSPCVMTLQSHGLSVGDAFKPYTTGSLPTGLTAGTTYYVVSTPSTDGVTFSATAGGAEVSTSGTQSGTHTITSNNTTIFAGFRTEVYMTYREYDSWRDMYLYGSLRKVQTRPMEMTVTPNRAIGAGPLPAAGYTMLGDYFRIPSDMAADADTPAMPSQFHLAIVYGAMMHYGAYEAAPEVYQRGEKEFKKYMSRLEIDQLPDLQFGGALA